MLILTNPGTADKLQLTSSSAANLDVHVSYADHTTSTDNVEAGRQLTAISSATTTDVCAGPASGVIRNVKTLHVRNKHASTSNDVTVIYDVAGTDYELHKATLVAGASLEYVEGIGFYTLEPAATSISRRVLLGSDQSNATTTPTEVTGLSTLTGTGTFKFQYLIRYVSSITTTGVRYSVNHDGTVTFFVANMLWVDTSATASTATPDQDAVGAAGQVYGAMAARAKSTAGWGTTLGTDTTGDMLIIIDGLMQVSVDGNIELWHGSETAASTTTKAGTALILEKIG